LWWREAQVVDRWAGVGDTEKLTDGWSCLVKSAVDGAAIGLDGEIVMAKMRTGGE
jgi:hypothetical protein